MELRIKMVFELKKIKKNTHYKIDRKQHYVDNLVGVFFWNIMFKKKLQRIKSDKKIYIYIVDINDAVLTKHEPF